MFHQKSIYINKAAIFKYLLILFAKTKSIFRERNVIFFLNYNLNPSMNIMDHTDISASNFMENCIGPKRIEC